jgi:hypothetical protein
MKLKQFYEKSKDYIDYKMAAAGGSFTGIWTLFANLEGPINHAIRSSTTQAVYTFLTGGIIMKTCENIATKIKDRRRAIAYSIIIPSLITIFATYGIHKVIKTENPKISTAPALLSIPACAVLGPRKRNKLEKMILEKSKK